MPLHERLDRAFDQTRRLNVSGRGEINTEEPAVAKKKLTKAEIVESIAEKTRLNKKDVHFIVDSFFDEVKAALKDDRIVELRSFGTFEIRTRKGRQKARNPKTGETIQVKNHGVTVFRPGKELKENTWTLRE
jgi:integration host factor subunit beta